MLHTVLLLFERLILTDDDAELKPLLFFSVKILGKWGNARLPSG